MGENNDFKDLIVEVKKVIVNVVNEEKDITITVDDFSDTEDISYSVVLQMSSLMAIKMVVELEKRFHIEVEDDDLDMKNFKNAETIASYVYSKMQEQ